MTAPLRREEIQAAKRAIAIAEQNDVEQDAPDRGSAARTLGDWLSDPALLRVPAIIIPHLAVEGRVSLLSGREKIGKTTLVANSVAAASRGDSVLGVEMVAPIKTLWYAIDEPFADTVRRFDALGADVEGIIINEEPRNFRDLLAALERDLKKFEDVSHVVVDTFSRVLASTNVDPNSSQEVEPIMAQLVDFFHRENVAATLNYHTGKGGKEYRGSTAIGASVDEVLTLRRRGQGEDDDFEEDNSDDGRRLLIQDGRNLRGRIQLTFRDGTYQPYEETSQPRERILAILRDHGVVVTRAELAKLAVVRKAIGLEVIRSLIGSGHIVESGRQLKLGSASSGEFPEKGTTSELIAELQPRAGSHSGKVWVPETGTEIEERLI